MKPTQVLLERLADEYIRECNKTRVMLTKVFVIGRSCVVVHWDRRFWNKNHYAASVYTRSGALKKRRSMAEEYEEQQQRLKAQVANALAQMRKNKKNNRGSK